MRAWTFPCEPLAKMTSVVGSSQRGCTSKGSGVGSEKWITHQSIWLGGMVAGWKQHGG